MPDNTIMGVVVLFIGVVILIGLTPIILGNTSSTDNCEGLSGSNTNFIRDGNYQAATGKASEYKTQVTDKIAGYQESSSTATAANVGKGSGTAISANLVIPADDGWSKSCYESAETNQDSFSVILVIPVVVAAVAILMVVRFL